MGKFGARYTCTRQIWESVPEVGGWTRKMKIIYLDIANIGELARVYNEQIAGIPHCYSMSPEEFEAGFPYQKHSRDTYHEDIHSEKIIVGQQNGRIRGFADVALDSN